MSIDPRTAPCAALVLRLALGCMFIAHSVWLKAVVYTLPGTASFFASIGLPGALAYVVFALEAIGGVALLLGVATRAVSLALLPVLLGATWAHAGNGWLFTNANGGFEYPLFLVAATLAMALLGDGAHALRVKRPGGPAQPAPAGHTRPA